MGCRLSQCDGADEAVGKIYSTLRRAQVERPVGVAYTYHFLDFLLGTQESGVSSVQCVSSVRELPVQFGDLYQQGFILTSVHPFVHSSAPADGQLHTRLHRAVFIRETHRCVESSALECVRPRLETDVCYSGVEVPEPDVVQGYLKKVQDQADSGVLLVGLLQQPAGAHCYLGGSEPDDLSSLHSSPSPTRPLSTDPAPVLHPGRRHGDRNPGTAGPNLTSRRGQNRQQGGPEPRAQDEAGHEKLTPQRGRQLQNQTPPGRRTGPDPTLNRVQLFALYNRVVVVSSWSSFYSLTVPVQVRREAGLITQLHAHWLHHITSHVRSGAQLVDAFFHPGDRRHDSSSSSSSSSSSMLDVVFIFQRSTDVMNTSDYDAMVVEQWTVVDGVVVKNDYIPLLQSLAPYGWRLMCVLPTPIIKPCSDGSLATKQILFLQRPALHHGRRRFTKLHLKGRNKRNLDGTQTTGSEETNERVMTAMKRKSWTSGEDEVEDADHGRSARVTRPRDQSQEEELRHGEKGGVTLRREVRSLVTEPALFSGVC